MIRESRRISIEHKKDGIKARTRMNVVARDYTVSGSITRAGSWS